MNIHAKMSALLLATLMASVLIPAIAVSASPDEQAPIVDAVYAVYIEGYVMDSASGAGLPGVTIQINETTVETNLTGYFRIGVSAPGDHLLKASSSVHKTFSTTLSVTEGDNAVIIRLNPITSKFGDSC